MTDKTTETEYIPPQSSLSSDERFFATIGYLGILCLVPLLLKKNSPFAQHHGKQGLVILVVWLGLWVGMIVPILGQIVWSLGSLALMILIILGMVNAFQGKMWDMPILGKYAKNLKL
ncbi:MAG: hypothetical protein UT30_C0020G0005 [Candidatus Uhrbacteria bacterium GW2011_GWF2_39_13]|uniref:Chloroplast import component protein (Tic20) n=1 Tax=Candidatus Uhrbacteria bacterium GW2011_GWF2_39_13 TaxID=1618995 RepID=A0A0G0MTJ7_9BACT|nr:MAG: hypothetical protein UT30_C0020G0005 [Candidatus Uhrbacteria bacterium GW2011_GWF2_39_13]HAU66722.1 hypothetical protein [Candidatus Uhrbacteria bacterium]